MEILSYLLKAGRLKRLITPSTKILQSAVFAFTNTQYVACLVLSHLWAIWSPD